MDLDDKKVVSVIIPIFNTERYLRKCILSIINQTYKNLEIILINDGSNDKSKAICEKYLERDSRINLINIKKSGVSVARNEGIRKSSGKYICFVDSDDWLSIFSIEKMIKTIEKEHAELCYGNYTKVELFKKQKELLTTKETYCKVADCTKFISVLNQMGFGPCWKLYDKKIIVDNNILFPIDQQLGEDQIFNLKYLQYCNKIALEKDVIYFYNRLNSNSITRTLHVNINLWSFEMANAYTKLFEKYLDEESVINFLGRKYIEFCYNACNHYITFETEMGKTKVDCKLIETISLFSNYLIPFTESTAEVLSQELMILKKYVQNQDIDNLKNEIRKCNYEYNLSIKKELVITALKELKILYYYKITRHIFDYKY